MTVTESEFVSWVLMSGYRRPNSALQSTNDPGVFMDEWPETMLINNRVYSLFEISSFENNLEEAKYVC